MGEKIFTLTTGTGTAGHLCEGKEMTLTLIYIIQKVNLKSL